MKALGHSIVAADYGVTPGYVAKIAADLGIAITNLGVDGMTVPAYAATVYAQAPDDALFMLGTNDHRINGADAGLRAAFGKGLQALVAWMALPSKVLAKDATVISGTWDTGSAYGFGRRSWASGSKIQAAFTGTVGYLGYIAQGSGSGQFRVWIDGANMGTFSTGVQTGNPGYGPQLARFAGLSAGTHQMIVECLSDGYPGGVVYPDWIAGNGQTSKAIYVADIIRMSAAGYATYNLTNDANVDAYNAELNARMAELVADGLAVKVVSCCAALSYPADLNADGVHPNASGVQKITTAHEGQMGVSAPPPPPPSPPPPQDTPGTLIFDASGIPYGQRQDGTRVRLATV